MFFTVISREGWVPDSGVGVAFLKEDNWDDWGKYRTAFDLVVFDQDGKRHDPGSVKIGERGLLPGRSLQPGTRAPSIPRAFDVLDDQFFSLGQGEDYYTALNALPEDLRTRVLKGLRDCAFDPSIFDIFADEDVMIESLLRSVSSTNLRNKLNRVAHGNPVLTRFHFEYRLPSNGEGDVPPTLTFLVEPFSEPPTNVHVLIGRNGVGKTRCMQGLARTILTDDPSAGVISPALGEPFDWTFAGLVAVTFSAFDRYVLPRKAELRPGMQGSLVGLRREPESDVADPNEGQPEQPQQSTPGDEPPEDAEIPKSFAKVFCGSLAFCRRGPRRDRLKAALATLSSDPVFAETEVLNLLDLSDAEWRAGAEVLFEELSSGHAVVLLTITRLVELVDERTIVLIDEPEGHLHPPLLSAFIRALSDLLVKRNGVALISTHSPVVLQEVPRSCVWKLNRFGSVAKAERPSIETFGENVGTLTREVFQLEVTNSGFHSLLQKAVENPASDYDTILAGFGNQLGAEARAIARSLLAVRDQGRNEEGT